MKKKVLFFVQSGRGGAEKMTLYIANCLNENEYDIIFYVIGSNSNLVQQYLCNTTNVHLIKVNSYRDFLTLKLIKVILKEKPYAVFSSVFSINWRLCFASIIFPKVKVILRSSNYLYTQSQLQKIRLFIAYKFMNYLIVQTEEMREEHINNLNLSPDKIITCQNPVDHKTITENLKNTKSPFSHEFTNYVYVGRLTKVKGVDILIKAFSKVSSKNSKSRLYIVGNITGNSAPYYNEIQTLIKYLNLDKYIIFTGFEPNPYVYMSYADCFVLASRNEGLPNVLIEALHLGTPVAVTNSIPVIQRIVENGINGFTCPVDNVDDLANAMISAANLGRVKSSYKSASPEDFVRLF